MSSFVRILAKIPPEKIDKASWSNETVAADCYCWLDYWVINCTQKNIVQV